MEHQLGQEVRVADPIAKLVPTAEFSTTSQIKVIPPTVGFPDMDGVLPMPRIDEKKKQYHNVNPTWKKANLGSVLKWKVAAKKDPPAPSFPTAKEAAIKLPKATSIDIHALHRFSPHGCPCATCKKGDADPYAGQVAATWCGHSTFVVTAGGYTVLTDPVLSYRASPVQFAGPARMVPTVIPTNDLPYVDVVTISHNHYDHLDTATVEALIRHNHSTLRKTQSSSCTGDSAIEKKAVFTHPVFVVPIGMKERWFCPLKKSIPELDLDLVVELMWWDTADVAIAVAANRAKLSKSDKASLSFTVAAVPVQHWATRNGMDLNRELWCGFDFAIGASTGNPIKLFHCGDTGYYKEVFEAIGKACGSFDFAMIPIGAYEPRYIMTDQHIDPFQAVQIHKDINARHSAGMHWGTFILTDEPVDEPPKALAVAMAAAMNATEYEEITNMSENSEAPNASKLKHLRNINFFEDGQKKISLTKLVGTNSVIPYFDCENPFRALMHGESWIIDVRK